MHKLVVLQDPMVIETRMRRLDEADIRATSVQEQTAANLYLGGALSFGIWVDAEEDLQPASEILREVQAHATSTVCPKCRYNLCGHSGLSACPECGFVITAPQADRTCPHCLEMVPATFEICWNCGTALESNEQSVREPTKRPRRTPPDHS